MTGTSPAGSSLLILAFDHRNSYERALPDATSEQYERGKLIVAAAVNDAVRELGSEAGVGLLTDLQFGQGAVAKLDPAAMSAVAIEKSGQAIFDLEWSDWAGRLKALDVNFAKVLVRYRADDSAESRAIQAERLLAVNETCTASGLGFLLEVITPFTDSETQAAESDLDATRLPLLLASMTDLQSRGINPEVWKVEGLDRVESCMSVTAQAQTVRDDVRVVVLGAGAGEATVSRWLQSARDGGYSGFAVGRSIWKAPLEKWFIDGNDDVAQQSVFDRYLGYTAIFTASPERSAALS